VSPDLQHFQARLVHCGEIPCLQSYLASWGFLFSWRSLSTERNNSEKRGLWRKFRPGYKDLLEGTPIQSDTGCPEGPGLATADANNLSTTVLPEALEVRIQPAP